MIVNDMSEVNIDAALAREGRFDQLLIEATGIAEPLQRWTRYDDPIDPWFEE